MPTPETFPKSVVLHFPPSIHQKIGGSDILPQLLEKLVPDEVRCVQFLRGGRVRVTFRESSACDYWLSEELYMCGHVVPVTRDHEKLSVLYLRDLPHQVHTEDLTDFFSAYGRVLVMERSTCADFPLLFDGNRVIKMILEKDLPYFLTVFGFECRLWYRYQPIQCCLCRELGHRAQSCPLSGRCRRCRQPGHVARECPQAWDPVSCVDPSSVPESDSVPIVSADPEELPSESDSVSADPEELPSVKPPVDVIPDDKLPVDVDPSADPVEPVEVSPGDPVVVSNVDVPTNISSVSEPAAYETVSFKDDALSSVSTSSGSNSDVLGPNGAFLFRQNLKTKSVSIPLDIWDRTADDLANAVSKISRDSFLDMSSSSLEIFIVNASRIKNIAKSSNLFLLMLFSLTKLQKVLRNT